MVGQQFQDFMSQQYWLFPWSQGLRKLNVFEACDRGNIFFDKFKNICILTLYVKIKNSFVYFWANMSIFWNWVPKNIPDQQKCLGFQKSQKSSKSFHPNVLYSVHCTAVDVCNRKALHSEEPFLPLQYKVYSIIFAVTTISSSALISSLAAGLGIHSLVIARFLRINERFAQKKEQFAHCLIFGERPERLAHIAHFCERPEGLAHITH